MSTLQKLINQKIAVEIDTEIQKTTYVGYLIDYDDVFIVINVQWLQRFSTNTFEKTIYIPISTITKITLFDE